MSICESTIVVPIFELSFWVGMRGPVLSSPIDFAARQVPRICCFSPFCSAFRFCITLWSALASSVEIYFLLDKGSFMMKFL